MRRRPPNDPSRRRGSTRRSGERPPERRAELGSRRVRPRLALALAVAMAGSVAALAIRSPGEPSAAPAAITDAIVEFEQALDPLAREGGRVVVQGLRAGIADLYYESAEATQVAEMAEGWRDQLATIREQIAALDAPAELDQVMTLFDGAMGAYVDTAAQLIRIARSSGGDVRNRLEEVGRAGERADGMWEQARTLLLRVRQRFGVEGPSPLA